MLWFIDKIEGIYHSYVQVSPLQADFQLSPQKFRRLMKLKTRQQKSQAQQNKVIGKISLTIFSESSLPLFYV